MFSPDFHALGFDFPEWEDLADAIIDTGVVGVSDVDPFMFVGLYKDESEAGVGIFRYEDDPPFTTPSLKGMGGRIVRAYQIQPSLALLDIYDDNGNGSPTWRLLAAVDDPHCYPLRPFGTEGEFAEYDDYRLSGAAIEVSIYPNEEAWKKDQTPIQVDNPPVPGMPNEIYIDPRFVTSPWLFALASGDNQPEEANPSAMFKGVVEKAELRTNSLTGQKWWRCEVDCGFPIAIALPEDINLAPTPGSVIDGNVFLLGSSGFWD